MITPWKKVGMHKNEPLKLNDNEADFEQKFYAILNNNLLLSAIAFCVYILVTISDYTRLSDYTKLSAISLDSFVFIYIFVFLYNVISISYIVIFAIVREIKLLRTNYK